jgi:hypothetical protein
LDRDNRKRGLPPANAANEQALEVDATLRHALK